MHSQKLKGYLYVQVGLPRCICCHLLMPIILGLVEEKCLCLGFYFHTWRAEAVDTSARLHIFVDRDVYIEACKGVGTQSPLSFEINGLVSPLYPISLK